MTTRPLILALILAGALSNAVAQPQLTAKEIYSVETKRAATRYADDKKLCAEESTSSVRMQCLRDAKSEYDKNMSAAKAALKAPAKPLAAAAPCNECGRVIAVSSGEKAGEGSALGVIAGGVAGALLGNQVGSGHGRELATVAGGAAGAYAGNKVEQRAKTTKVWTVQVQYGNGDKSSYQFDHEPGMNVGDQVRSSNGSIVRR